MARRTIRLLLVLSFVALLAIAVVMSRDPSQDRDEMRDSAAAVAKVQDRPIDPRQQTALAFGDRSHWLQPWRAYLDTVPASRLLDAAGMQFNVKQPAAVPATARLLAASGFSRARVEIGWDQMDYANPRRLTDPAAVAAGLRALSRPGLRPLILLNANHGAPGPVRKLQLRVARAVEEGDRSVVLDKDSARQVKPRLTGFDAAGRNPAVLITSVSRGGRAQLSRASPVRVAAGTSLPATTLRYEPFARPRAADGRANPAFERTMTGWLAYVRAVTSQARDAVGSEEFDVEVWNEETFGSDFLDAAKYYDPVPARLRGTGHVKRQLLDRTVAYIRSPASGVASIGVGDGFSNQTPFPAGSTSPPGLTAIDKHPYHGFVRFPDPSKFTDQRPLDALGRPDGIRQEGRWRERFTPSYTGLFPEWYMSALQTEHLVRDLSPITTKIQRVSHGRRTGPRGGKPPQLWITETNLDPTGVPLSTPGARGGTGMAPLGPAELRHFQAKVLLRTLSTFVNKGASSVFFYAAEGEQLGFVPQDFLDQAAGGSEPDPAVGGEGLATMRRFMAAFRGGPRRPRPRSLRLLAVDDDHDNRQFEGDGTKAHPDLFDRDVFAFLPFQVTEHRFVVPVYVMTRDMGKRYRGQSGVKAMDLPPERFRITVAGVSGRRLQASLTDPLNGRRAPVRVIKRAGDRVTLELSATDSPRLLTLRD